MPFWRKKNDGFEWNKYVRTTVLVRRKERRQKLEDVGAAAAFGVRQAKWKSIAHAKAAAHAVGRGSVAAARGVRSGSKASWTCSWPRIQSAFRASQHAITTGFWATLAALGSGLRITGQGTRYFLSNVARPAVGRVHQWAKIWSAPAIKPIAKPEVIGPLSLIASIATLGAAANFITSGLTSETLFVTGIALSLLGLVVVAWPPDHSVLSVLPTMARPDFSNLNPSPRTIGVAIAIPVLALITGGAYWLMADGKLQWAQLPSLQLPELPSVEMSALNPFKSEILKGRARALDGGHLRIAKQRIRLDNIEALLPGQTCTTHRGRRWRCGRKAKDQLARLVRRHTLTCTVSGQDDDRVKQATCHTKNGDIAAALVSKGYAFAHLGALANYRDEENAARQNKRGIWQGSAERPSDYRMASWDKAAKTAPEGCPIKGRVIRRQRFYALPWDRGYARAKIRPRRGEKWFCTEQDARAAGFKRAS